MSAIALSRPREKHLLSAYGVHVHSTGAPARRVQKPCSNSIPAGNQNNGHLPPIRPSPAVAIDTAALQPQDVSLGKKGSLSPEALRGLFPRQTPSLHASASSPSLCLREALPPIQRSGGSSPPALCRPRHRLGAMCRDDTRWDSSSALQRSSGTVGNAGTQQGLEGSSQPRSTGDPFAQTGSDSKDETREGALSSDMTRPVGTRDATPADKKPVSRSASAGAHVRGKKARSREPPQIKFSRQKSQIRALQEEIRGSCQALQEVKTRKEEHADVCDEVRTMYQKSIYAAKRIPDVRRGSQCDEELLN